MKAGGSKGVECASPSRETIKEETLLTERETVLQTLFLSK